MLVRVSKSELEQVVRKLEADGHQVVSVAPDCSTPDEVSYLVLTSDVGRVTR